MIDLDTAHCDWLVHEVRRHQDTYELVRHLRRGGIVNDDLKALLADILEDKIRPKPRVKPRTIKHALSYTDRNGRIKPNILLSGTLAYLKEMLEDPTEADLRWVKQVLKGRGGLGPIDTIGQRTVVAKKLVMARYRLTWDQLDEILSQRRARVKN